MKQSIKHILFLALALSLLLAACAPGAAPTQDPALVQQLIKQAVELTVAAQNIQATEEQALIVPSNTPLPTQTEAVPPTPTTLIPSATPFVVVPPPTAVPSGGGGGGVTTVKPEYACDIIRQRPYDDQAFKPKDTFDIKWTIVNTGTKAWVKGLDLKYNYGPKMTATSLIELPAMQPGDQYQVVLDGAAPSEEGIQVMTWVIEGGFCYPYVRIIVEK